MDLVHMSAGAWDAYTRGSAIRREDYGGLRRDLAIALDNWLSHFQGVGPGRCRGAAGALSDDDEVVAESAAWALDRAKRGLAGEFGATPRDGR